MVEWRLWSFNGNWSRIIRVLDKQFSECPYTKADLARLYRTNFSEKKSSKVALPTRDDLLQKLLEKFPHIIAEFHNYEDMFKSAPANVSARQIAEAKKDLQKNDISPKKRRKVGRYTESHNLHPQRKAIPPGTTPYLYGLERKHFSEVINPSLFS